MGVRRFEIDVAAPILDDLHRRLTELRWPTDATVDALSDVGSGPTGLSRDWLQALTTYWRSGFDWRAQQATLNSFTQVQVDLGDQIVHAVHVPGRGPHPLPLLLCHGWPSSFVEFTKVIPRLTDPAAFGEDPRDAFTVVVPSLPGYLFSTPLPAGHSGGVVALYADLMTQLGYDRFGVHGGDIGSYVCHRLALDHRDRVMGLHTTYPAEPSPPTAAVPADEARFLAERAAELEPGGGYSHMQRTRPLTLAYGLTDSPLALAAWLLDKWRDWTDCNGDLDTRFTFDELLTLITLYWATGCIGTSFSFYRDWGLGAPVDLVDQLYPRSLPGVEPRPLTEDQRIEVPAAVALFKMRYPSSFVARSYADLRRLTVMPRGGHFAACEEPDLLINDLREFFDPLRATESETS
jgi:pimeloyl-ACP methyl ester carboxylesterase